MNVCPHESHALMRLFMTLPANNNTFSPEVSMSQQMFSYAKIYGIQQSCASFYGLHLIVLNKNQ